MRYYWKAEASHWEIEDIEINRTDQKRGYGTRLMREFVTRIGPNQRVRGSIAHEETRELLYERYGERAAQGSIKVEGEELLDLPLVKVRDRAGIRNHSVTLTYHSEDPGLDDPIPSDFYEMDIEGITGESKR
jgi:hypothetical protein